VTALRRTSHSRGSRLTATHRSGPTDAQLERILDAAGRPGDRDRGIVVLLA
jgi:hypothetical protein